MPENIYEARLDEELSSEKKSGAALGVWQAGRRGRTEPRGATGGEHARVAPLSSHRIQQACDVATNLPDRPV